MLLHRRQEKALWLLEGNKKSFQQSLNTKEKSFTVTRKLSTQAELSRWTSFTKQVKV